MIEITPSAVLTMKSGVRLVRHVVVLFYVVEIESYGEITLSES